MPRQAHGRSLLDTRPQKVPKRKNPKARGLNALETAERQFPEKFKIRQHRLGEVEEEDDRSNPRADSGERSAKRRKLDSTGATIESDDEGSDPDGNPWHVGVDEDDEDSDIDSDEAFGESDEERFADFTFRGSDHPKQSKKSGNDDTEELSEPSDPEDQEQGDDDLGEDAIDLAAAWDLDDEQQREEQERANRKKQASKPAPSLAESDSDESPAESASEVESEEEEQRFEEFSDDNDLETNARLRSFVDGLIPEEKSRLKPRSYQRNASYPDKPSPFALSSTGLSAADLMQYVKDPTQRQSLKMLQAAEREDGSHHTGGVPGKLAVPLAKRQQDRLDRVAAYDQTKQAVDRWVDTVKQNRRADHVAFPLIDTTKASASSVKTFQPLTRSQPQSELESKIQEIMQESGLAAPGANDEEAQEREYEELQAKKLPLEEVQARRRELRMQRELMFREEVRAKRIKKIKSKAYRRVHRREKDKFAVQERERLAAAGILDSDEEREKNDRRRAEERMGARHRESRWAKAAKATGQTVWNEDARVGVSELARRDEELRRRIEGKNSRGSDESSGETDSEYSNSDEEGARWEEKLEKLETQTEPQGKSKLADMAFMKRAEADRKARNDAELRSLRRSMQAGSAEQDGGSDDDEQAGRQKFGSNNAKNARLSLQPFSRSEFEERLSEDEQEEHEAEAEPGPGALSSATPAVTTAMPTQGQARVRALSRTHQPLPPTALPPSNPRARADVRKKQPAESAVDDYTSPSESEAEQHDGLDDKDRLALDIFAGDDEEDLRKQFRKEKQRMIDEQGDQVLDNTLPGWGSWTGAGVSKREQKKAKGRFLTTVKGVAPEARKDAKLDRVIINEKRVKKNDKYLANDLPHPFESRQQYERSLRLPMGPEWSTRNHFQDSIKPRVLLKQGHVIRAMAKPSA